MAGNDLIGRIEAQDKANEKAAIEAENKLREKINPTTLYNIFGKKDVTPEAIKARINSLQKDIKTFTGNEKYRPRIHEMQDVWDIMRTAEKAAENDVFTSGIVEDFQRRFHGTTKEGFLKELKDSLEKKEYAIIAFGDKNST